MSAGRIRKETVTQYTTTDGEVFLDREAACRHQRTLNVELLLAEHWPYAEDLHDLAQKVAALNPARLNDALFPDAAPADDE